MKIGIVGKKDYRERIRDLREDNDLPQKAIADYLGVDQRTYSDYELGNANMTIERINMLAKYYDVSLDYIIDASNIKNKYPQK